METQDGRHPARDTDPQLTAPSNGRARIGQTPGRTPWVQGAPHPSGSPEPLQIIESTADGCRVIAPCGELDLSNAAELEQRLAGSIDTVLDLSELSFIDSTGIRVLIGTAQRAQQEAWEFTVRSPQPAVVRAIELVGLDQHLGLEQPRGPASQRDERARATGADGGGLSPGADPCPPRGP